MVEGFIVFSSTLRVLCMARTIGEVSLAAELWTPAVQQRFEALFAVAARKSLSGWRQVPRHAAEVLVIEGLESLLVRAEARAPCVVYLGGEPAMQPLGRSFQGWAVHLDVDFTLSDLIDMLDRAAVFLMDWRARHRAGEPLPLQRALQELQSQGVDCTHCFQIKSWVALPGSVNSAQNMRALALLARGPINARSLAEHAGIEMSQLSTLLSLPQIQAVLRCSLRGSEEPSAAQKSIAQKQPAASVTRQWLSKLTGWITRGGRT
ncbi:hypothetical protein INP81_02035 [Comamonas thiooxydans]|uniref:hypothetical protein n=1 Tax=Comamonas thiooxydans TaxID=363952 RepID=UPI0018A48810|nr:hypothetical protein [Comamonas thiooxydans]QOQ84495.1 hypothetical protein INP81_02035 [Comamonas thiooxydans]